MTSPSSVTPPHDLLAAKLSRQDEFEADAYARLAFAKAQTRTLATPTSY